MIRRVEELIGVPLLVRTHHPTTRFPWALLREDDFKVLQANSKEEIMSHLDGFSFYRNRDDGTIRIQHSGWLTRAAYH